MWKATHHKKVEVLLAGQSSDAPAAWRAIVDRGEDLQLALLDEVSPGKVIHYVGWRVAVHDLATEDDVEAKVLSPLRAALERASVPPTP